jgi:hypothetical protein
VHRRGVHGFLSPQVGREGLSRPAGCLVCGQKRRLFTFSGIFTAAMNIDRTVNKPKAFDAEALRILRDIPGVSVEPEPGGADRGVDAIVRFSGAAAKVAVEFKSRANAASAWQLVHYANQPGAAPLLLVAGETTAEARDILREHGIAIVDGLGNAHIELPGLLLHLQGSKRPRRDQPAQLVGKAGVVAQALLLDPSRVWQVSELAERAQVSGGLAHRVLARLDREGVTVTEGSGPRRVRRVTDPTALFDLWAEEDRPRAERTTGHLLARTPEQLISKLGEKLGDRVVDYAVTGAAAASLIAPFATAVPVIDVWTSASTNPKEWFDAVGAEQVESGQNIALLQAKHDGPLAFREKREAISVANKFRVYVDLLADPRRGAEQAKHLRSEVIGF